MLEFPDDLIGTDEDEDDDGWSGFFDLDYEL